MNQLMRFFPNTENTVSKKIYSGHILYSGIKDFGIYTFLYPENNKLIFRGKTYRFDNNISEKDIDFFMKCYVNYFTCSNKLIRVTALSNKEMEVNFGKFHITFDISKNKYTIPKLCIDNEHILLNEKSCPYVYKILNKYGIGL